MPLSGTFNVRHSLFLQQRVKIIIVGSVTSFASNEKRGQCFPLRICNLKGTHNLQVVWRRTEKELIYTVTKCKKSSPWCSSELGLLNYSHTVNDHTYWNESLQCIQPGFSASIFNHWICVGYSKRRSLWPAPMWLQFDLLPDCDHELSSRFDVRKGSTGRHKLCISS